MKKLLIVMTVALACQAGLATAWRGLTKENHYFGPTRTSESLIGKLVLVFVPSEISKNKGPFREMEKYWQKYKSRGVVLIGSNRFGNKTGKWAKHYEDCKSTYSMYEGAGIAEGEPEIKYYPFFYLVNHRGKVVYQGNGMHDPYGFNASDAFQATDKALREMTYTYDLTRGVKFNKFKEFKPKLVFGKSIAAPLRKLKAAFKKSRSRNANAGEKELGEEAKQIFVAMAKVKQDIKDDIEVLMVINPSLAEKHLKSLMITFPEEAEMCKNALAELAEEKEKAKPKKAKK